MARHRYKSQSTPSEYVSLLQYSKTSCGVDFLLNTSTSRDKEPWFCKYQRFQTDFYEFYFFHQASGYLLLNGERIDLCANQVLIIAPYQQQEWHVSADETDYTFLVFQEEFVSSFISDKYFMYRLLYCYQHDNPSAFTITDREMTPFMELLSRMRGELRRPIADSYSLIVAYLVEFLLQLNRLYAAKFNLPLRLPTNNFAFQYKELLEKHIRSNLSVSDYAAMIGISRISLNKAVYNEFGVTARHLLQQRRLQELKNDLLFSNQSLKEIADSLNFSAPNHMMRFFKQLTGKTVSEYVNDVRSNGHS